MKKYFLSLFVVLLMDASPSFGISACICCDEDYSQKKLSYILFRYVGRPNDKAILWMDTGAQFSEAIGGNPGEITIELSGCDQVIIPGDRLKSNSNRTKFRAKSAKGETPKYSLFVDYNACLLRLNLSGIDLKDCVFNPVKVCVSTNSYTLCAEREFKEKRDRKDRLIKLSRKCSYSISPRHASFKSNGGSGIIDISTPEGCSWRAVSNTNWIHPVSEITRDGDGTIQYIVDANNSLRPREGVIKIINEFFTKPRRTFVVSQAAVPIAGEWTGWIYSNNADRKVGISGEITTNAEVFLRFTYGHPCPGDISGRISLNQNTFHVGGRAPAFDCGMRSFTADGTIDGSYSQLSGVWAMPGIGDGGEFYLRKR